MRTRHIIVFNAEDMDMASVEVEENLNNSIPMDSYYDLNGIFDLNNLSEQEKAYIEKQLNEINKEITNTEEIISKINKLQSEVASRGREVYWELSQEYKNLYEILGQKELYSLERLKKADFVGGYNAFHYTEFGITNLCTTNSTDGIFLALVDVHY